MTAIPAVYRRESASKLVGCLVYLVVAPFVALILALFIAVPLMFGLEALGVSGSKDLGGLAFVVLLPLMGVGVAIWGYRDYRRRASLEVVIDRDRVTIRRGRAEQVLLFEDVISVRLVPTPEDFACVLGRRSGGRVQLPLEVAWFTMVRGALEITLIRQMVSRLDDRIGAAKPWPSGSSWAGSWS